MKSIKIIIFLFFILFSLQRDLTEERRKESLPYAKLSKLAYCSSKTIKDNTCEACYEIFNSNYEIQKVYEYPPNNKTTSFKVKMVVAISPKNETVIIFGGPKSNEISKFMNMYSKQKYKIQKWDNLLIEKDFMDIYRYFYPKVKKLFQKASQITFTGHSFGGSLAALGGIHASFSKKMKNKKIKVFSFGTLKIGPKDMWVKLAKKIGKNNVFRIRKKKDLYTLLPRCVYVKNKNVFRCYKKIKYIFRAHPKLRVYFSKKSKLLRLSGGKLTKIQLIRQIKKLKTMMKKIQKKLKTTKNKTIKTQLAKKLKQIKNKIIKKQTLITKNKRRKKYNKNTKKRKKPLSKKIQRIHNQIQKLKLKMNIEKNAGRRKSLSLQIKKLRKKARKLRQKNKRNKIKRRRRQLKKNQKNTKNKNKKDKTIFSDRKNNKKKKQNQKKMQRNKKKTKKNIKKLHNGKRANKSKSNKLKSNKNKKNKKRKTSNFLQLYSSFVSQNNKLISMIGRNKQCIMKKTYVECNVNQKIHSTFYSFQMENCS